MLAQGIDPSAQKKADKAESAAKNEHTFSIIAAELLEKLIKEGKAEGTIKQKRRLRTNIGQVFRYAIATARATNDLLITSSTLPQILI